MPQRTGRKVGWFRAWTKRLTLRQRILAVNIFAVAILFGAVFYLDSFRTRLTQARMEQAQSEAVMIAHMMAAVPPEAREPILIRLGRDSGTRLRLYAPAGQKVADSWTGAPSDLHPSRSRQRSLVSGLRGLARQCLRPARRGAAAARLHSARQRHACRLAGGAGCVAQSAGPQPLLRRAPDGTPFIASAQRVESADRSVLLLTVNARDVRRVVRAERLNLFLLLLATLIVSILLSRFLARTIANPLRRLAHAAHRVRRGSAREVDVPTLPLRTDEIGQLARALHDMTQSLRQRIDATDAFAADVTHELKNPLASLRSAVDTLDRVDDPAIRRQLLDVVQQDVRRLDRLVVEIAEASRLDAELSRARFEPVDLGRMIEALVPVWEERAASRAEIAFARPRAGTATMMGDEFPARPIVRQSGRQRDFLLAARRRWSRSARRGSATR